MILFCIPAFVRINAVLIALYLINLGNTQYITTEPTPKPARQPRYRITSILEAPYLFAKNNCTACGNRRYSGLIKDILVYLSRDRAFFYDIHIVKDGQYGSLNPNARLSGGEWSGMIGEVINKTADIAAAPLTVTELRRTYVDFTAEFQTLGPVIVSNANVKLEAKHAAFRLLNPLHYSLWLLLILAYVVVVAVLYLVTRISPSERKADLPKKKWSLCNVALFVASTFMWQGYERIPKSFAGRLIAVFWWIFTAFTLITYIAAVVVTFISPDNSIIESMFSINSIYDLASQSQVKYGLVNGGSTMAFFRQSDITQFQYIWKTIESSGTMTNTVSEGLRRVRSENGRYAFIMESSMANYAESQPPCDLRVSSQPAAELQYAFAVSRGNRELLNNLNEGLVNMKRNGKLQFLMDKWFEDRCKGTRATRALAAGLGNKLTGSKPFDGVYASDFAVPLALLVLGLIFALVAVLIERNAYPKKQESNPSRHNIISMDKGALERENLPFADS